jgi:hypothetical protein
MSSRQRGSGNSLDGQTRTARVATAWAWLTSPHHGAPSSRTLPDPAPAPQTHADRFGATNLGRLRLQATCAAVSSGYLPGQSMARLLTGQYPYDSEQLDSALSRGELDWPRHECGMDDTPYAR